MKKHLYDSFADRWCRGGQIYFYSDPHFGDQEAQEFRNYCISDDQQVASINNVVGKNDTLVMLGDIGDISFIPKLRGYKVLIMGNHDRGASNYQKQGNNNLFDEVYEGPLIISEKIILSHEPLVIPYMFNIHGHDHSNIFPVTANHLNVCCELIGYTPVSLKSIVAGGCLKAVDTLHRQTIEHRAYTNMVYEEDL